jgi:hypothetical protein
VTDFPKALRGFTAALFTAAVATAVGLIAHGPVPDWKNLLLLVALVVFSANQMVILPNGTFVSSAVMIYMAATVVFVNDGSLAGPMLIGMAGALNFRSFRPRSRGWILFNSGATGFAVLGAAVTYAAIEHSSDWTPLVIIAAIAAGVVYVCIAWSMVAASYLVEERRVPRQLFSTLGMLICQAVPFAVVGMFLGRLAVEIEAPVLLLILVPILIAREMFGSYMKVKEAHDETLRVLIRALEAKDRYTAGHAERVAQYAMYMGEQMRFGPARMERLRFAALMHDIGKLVVPNHILNKPGKLTEEEFARVRVHEKVTVQMLSRIEFLRPIASSAHSDNTTFDPDDPQHPIEPYILMIADAYDAMTSTRAYRKALSQEVAFAELRDKAGIQFHPACVEALITAIEARGERHGAGYEMQDEFADAPEAGLGSAGLGDLLPAEA